MPGERSAQFGLILQRYRLAAGLSQEELAERAGLSRRGISDLERGARRAPHPATVRRLAEALGLTDLARAELLGRTDRESPAPSPTLSPRDLPLPLTSFVGRAGELAEVRRLLGTTRLLTLIGTGGVGKTRLALRVAAEVRDNNACAVALVELADLMDPERVPETVASVLGIPEQPGRAALDVLADVLRPFPLLLVLDNCEHLIPACAKLADRLLRSCADLSILATSREALGIDGETAWRVPSLSVPDLQSRLGVEHLARSEAVQLFVLRAAATLPGFTPTERNAPAIARVCARLDGIPLALELAATRAALLSVEQIAEQLDDALRLLTVGSRTAPARQQTLRATLDWSFNLLSTPERRLLERLAVFAGGWTLEAAESVCVGSETETGEVLDLLGRLVAKSLVLAEPTPDGAHRYRLLESVRQFAASHLAADGQTASIHDRHTAYFLDLAERGQAVPWSSPEWGELAARLRPDLNNLRVALRWLIECGAREQAWRLGSSLARFWLFIGNGAEGRAWMDDLLGLGTEGSVTPTWTRLMLAATSVALTRWDVPVVHRFGEQALAAARQTGPERALAWADFLLTAADLTNPVASDYQRIRERIEEGLTASRLAAEPILEAALLNERAMLEIADGDIDAAIQTSEMAKVLAERVGGKTEVGRALCCIGGAYYARGQLNEARDFMERGVALWQSWGEPTNELLTMRSLLCVVTDQGELRRARALLTDLRDYWQQLGQPPGMGQFVLECCAYLAAAEGRPMQALRALGALEAMDVVVEELVSASIYGRGNFQIRLEQAKSALGEDTRARAVAEGRSLSILQVCQSTLSAADGETSADQLRGHGTSTTRRRRHGMAKRVADTRSGCRPA